MRLRGIPNIGKTGFRSLLDTPYTKRKYFPHQCQRWMNLLYQSLFCHSQNKKDKKKNKKKISSHPTSRMRKSGHQAIPVDIVNRTGDQNQQAGYHTEKEQVELSLNALGQTWPGTKWSNLRHTNDGDHWTGGERMKCFFCSFSPLAGASSATGTMLHLFHPMGSRFNSRMH